MTDKVAQAIAEISAKLDKIEAMVAELTGQAVATEGDLAFIARDAEAQAESKPAAQPKEEKISMDDFVRVLENRLRDAAIKHSDYWYAATCPGSVRLEAPARKARYEEEEAKLNSWYAKGKEQFSDRVAWQELLTIAKELDEADRIEAGSIWAAVNAISA